MAAEDESLSDRLVGARKAFGPYRLVRILAEGATGIVLQAEHRTMGRTVAIKTFHPRGFERSGLTVAGLSDRFLHEARTLAKFYHENVITVYDAGHARAPGLSIELPYLALTLAESDLERDVTAQGCLPDHQVITIARAVTKGLQHIHKGGFAHSDGKPANILRLPTGTYCWSDFSSATLLTNTEKTGTGSPGYMAPELRFGAPASVTADMYSVGATLQFCMTGKAPSEIGEGSAVRACMAGSGTIADQRQRQALVAVVAHCLNEDPTKRYQSTDPLLEDLAAIGGGEQPIHAPMPRAESSFIAGLWRRASRG